MHVRVWWGLLISSTTALQPVGLQCMLHTYARCPPLHCGSCDEAKEGDDIGAILNELSDPRLQRLMKEDIKAMNEQLQAMPTPALEEDLRAIAKPVQELWTQATSPPIAGMSSSVRTLLDENKKLAEEVDVLERTRLEYEGGASGQVVLKPPTAVEPRRIATPGFVSGDLVRSGYWLGRLGLQFPVWIESVIAARPLARLTHLHSSRTHLQHLPASSIPCVHPLSRYGLHRLRLGTGKPRRGGELRVSQRSSLQSVAAPCYLPSDPLSQHHLIQTYVLLPCSSTLPYVPIPSSSIYKPLQIPAVSDPVPIPGGAAVLSRYVQPALALFSSVLHAVCAALAIGWRHVQGKRQFLSGVVLGMLTTRLMGFQERRREGAACGDGAGVELQ